MAKSFKKPPAASEQPKRISEKDIFDFLDEDRVPSAPATESDKNNSSNTSTIGNTDNIGNTNNNNVTSATTVMTVTDQEADVRQTFVVGQRYLERLKDYVHTKRMQGQYEYTQKQALHDALDKLFEGVEIEARPAHIRQQEESRKQRIRRGISK